jgi:hypothetical protein
MATKKVKAGAKGARKVGAKGKAAARKAAALDLGKYMEQIKIGSYSWDDVLKSTSKNMDAVAEANRAIIDGYTDIAKRQYQMLRDLLDELRKVAGDRDTVVKELKRVVERARKDVQTLQKMASRTNNRAQRIVQKRADANLKAWKKLVADAKKAVTGKQPAAKKKASSKKKAAAKKQAAPKKKAAAKKKAATKKKAASRRKAAPKKQAAS